MNTPVPNVDNKPIAFLWETFARAVMPPNVDKVQHDEMRKAFFAGAVGLYMQIMQGLTNERGANPGEIQFMLDLQHEIRAYHEEAQQTAIAALFEQLRADAAPSS